MMATVDVELVVLVVRRYRSLLTGCCSQQEEHCGIEYVAHGAQMEPL